MNRSRDAGATSMTEREATIGLVVLALVIGASIYGLVFLGGLAFYWM